MAALTRVSYTKLPHCRNGFAVLVRVPYNPTAVVATLSHQRVCVYAQANSKLTTFSTYEYTMMRSAALGVSLGLIFGGAFISQG